MFRYLVADGSTLVNYSAFAVSMRSNRLRWGEMKQRTRIALMGMAVGEEAVLFGGEVSTGHHHTHPLRALPIFLALTIPSPSTSLAPRLPLPFSLPLGLSYHLGCTVCFRRALIMFGCSPVSPQ